MVYGSLYHNSYTHRTDVCPEPVFSRMKRPFFFKDPHEVCANYCETSHEAHFEPRMKHMLKPWENWDVILGER